MTVFFKPQLLHDISSAGNIQTFVKFNTCSLENLKDLATFLTVLQVHDARFQIPLTPRSRVLVWELIVLYRVK